VACGRRLEFGALGQRRHATAQAQLSSRSRCRSKSAICCDTARVGNSRCWMRHGPAQDDQSLAELLAVTENHRDECGFR
jgi:hypothetical protein